MKFFIACLTFVLFLATANAQIFAMGHCPKVIIQKDLDLPKLLSTWHVHSAYPFLTELEGSCINVTFSILKKNTLNMTTKQVYKNPDLENVSIPIKYIGHGIFNIHFSTNNNTVFLSHDYNILATDYENYAVIYSCRKMKNSHAIVTAIFTRERIPTRTVVKTAKDKIVAQDLPLKFLAPVNQRDCNN